jgi:hypothetical protein
MRTTRLLALTVAITFGIFLGLIAAPAEASILITVDKSTQQMTVAVDGATRWTWPVSTGRSGYDTPSGHFTASRMEASHFSKEWDDAPMPHSIFFTARGHAIHGSYETRYLGSAVSHGCVRLSPGNAAKLYALVQEEGLPNTKIVLTGDGPEGLARRGSRGRDDLGPDEPFTSPRGGYGYAPRYDYGQPRYDYGQRNDYRNYAPFGSSPYQGNYGYRPY